MSRLAAQKTIAEFAKERAYLKARKDELREKRDEIREDRKNIRAQKAALDLQFKSLQGQPPPYRDCALCDALPTVSSSNLCATRQFCQ